MQTRSCIDALWIWTSPTFQRMESSMGLLASICRYCDILAYQSKKVIMAGQFPLPLEDTKILMMKHNCENHLKKCTAAYQLFKRSPDAAPQQDTRCSTSSSTTHAVRSWCSMRTHQFALVLSACMTVQKWSQIQYQHACWVYCWLQQPYAIVRSVTKFPTATRQLRPCSQEQPNTCHCTNTCPTS